MYYLTDAYFQPYFKDIGALSEKIENFKIHAKELSFDYLIESSSLYSSNIEGNSLDLNSLMNAKMNFEKPKEVEEIEDLVSAYDFARIHPLNEKHFLHTHFLLSATLLIDSKRGIYRDDRVGVFWSTGLVYLAIEPEFVTIEMKKLFEDIQELVAKELSHEEVFYYASYLHLVFVHIHPFSDGNWRAARLLEKRFLVSKLWEDFRKYEAEKYYKEHRWAYYQHLNLWVDRYHLDYSKCLPFLQMLPRSLDTI